MDLYEVIAPAADGVPTVAVFAESYDTAVQIYMAWWVCYRGGELPNLEVKKCDPRWQGRNRQHLQDALDSGGVGVGRYEPESGWTILRPDDAREALA